MFTPGQQGPSSFIEFYDQPVIAGQYRVMRPSPALADYVEFYWESQYTKTGAFSIRTFPRVGSSWVFNLRTPFLLQKGNQRLLIRKDCRYLRDCSIVSHHRPDNLLFGIQLRTGPGFLEGKFQNISDKKSAGTNICKRLRHAGNMEERVAETERILLTRLDRREEYKINTVNEILAQYGRGMDSYTSMGPLYAGVYRSSKTVERHFKACTGLNPKQAVKLIRIRSALPVYLANKSSFDFRDFGYYDSSHFHKELKWFING